MFTISSKAHKNYDITSTFLSTSYSLQYWMVYVDTTQEDVCFKYSYISIWITKWIERSVSSESYSTVTTGACLMLTGNKLYYKTFDNKNEWMTMNMTHMNENRQIYSQQKTSGERQ